MSLLLRLRDFQLEKKGPALSLDLRAGQSMGVYGPSGSGKSEFLRCVAGLAKGARGSVRCEAEAALAGQPKLTRRDTPEALARRAAGRSGASRAAEALAAAGLWEARKTSAESLSSGQRAAAEMLAVLAGTAPLGVLDGQLERVDPWCRHRVLDLLNRRRSEGMAAIVATGLPELLMQFDLVVVWSHRSPAFAGPPADLARRHGPVALEVETVSQEGVRALCDPFQVRCQTTEDGVRIEADAGQSVAAHLLREGYGDVRAIITREPTPEELLLEFR